jgi:hypothetical protein
MHDHACVDSQHCDIQLMCPGTCQPRIAVGQPYGTAECVKGAYAFGGTGLCELPAAPGDSCASADGGPYKRECALGSFCNVQGICAPFIASGAACTANDLCVAGTLCINGTCQRLAGVGAPCTPSLIAPIGGCLFDLSCLGTCGPPSSLGGACFDQTDCAPGGFCFNATGGYLPDGGTFLDAGVCTMSGVAIGAPCATRDDAQCADTAFCGDGGLCTARLAAGAPCQRDSQCGTGTTGCLTPYPYDGGPSRCGSQSATCSNLPP